MPNEKECRKREVEVRRMPPLSFEWCDTHEKPWAECRLAEVENELNFVGRCNKANGSAVMGLADKLTAAESKNKELRDAVKLILSLYRTMCRLESNGRSPDPEFSVAELTAKDVLGDEYELPREDLAWRNDVEGK